MIRAAQPASRPATQGSALRSPEGRGEGGGLGLSERIVHMPRSIDSMSDDDSNITTPLRAQPMLVQQRISRAVLEQVRREIESRLTPDEVDEMANLVNTQREYEQRLTVVRLELRQKAQSVAERVLS